MKKIHMIISFALLFSSAVFAQDTIYLTDRKIKTGKVLKIDSTASVPQVLYTSAADLKNYNIRTSYIVKIVYEGGKVQVFKAGNIQNTNIANKATVHSDSLKNENNKKYMNSMTEKTKCPADNYKGGDRESLKKNIISTWVKDDSCLGKYQILKVYITNESWSKEKGYNYSKTSDSFKKYDESYLDVAVIFVPKDKPVIYNGTEFPEVAQIFRYSLVKDNTNKGLINYVNFECHHLSGGSNDLLTAKGKYILKSNMK